MAQQSGERNDFPILCETCLGDNPYVRMIRAHLDRECKICSRPFTVYQWKAGSEGRIKKTEICPTCAKVKHACQTCLFDLTTGLPLQVRDTLLKQQGSSSGALDITRPQSQQMLAYQAILNERAVSSQGLSPVAVGVLQGLSKSEPDYRRNRAKICTFWLKGTCNRGETCPFRHEQSDHKDSSLASQNIKDRYYGTQDPLAKKILDRVNTDQKKSEVGQEVTTVWVSGVNPEKNITEQDLKDYFYPFGEIIKIRLVPASKCAFVEYVSHDEAARAIQALKNNLVIRGQFLKVNWAKPQVQDPDAVISKKQAAQLPILPPPGFIPYNPMAPGAPPPGAAGPLGWAPMYYPSMNPQRMGSIEPQLNTTDNDTQQAQKTRTQKHHPKPVVEEPGDNSTVTTKSSSNQDAESEVTVTEVVESAEEVPAGTRIKRSGGSDGSPQSKPGRSKKVKV